MPDRIYNLVFLWRPLWPVGGKNYFFCLEQDIKKIVKVDKVTAWNYAFDFNRPSDLSFFELYTKTNPRHLSIGSSGQFTLSPSEPVDKCARKKSVNRQRFLREGLAPLGGYRVR